MQLIPTYLSSGGTTIWMYHKNKSLAKCINTYKYRFKFTHFPIADVPKWIGENRISRINYADNTNLY